MKAKCSRDGCGRPATHGLEIRLWAKWHPKHQNNYMKMYMPLPLCLGCALETKPETFFIEESWLRIESAIVGMGRAAPDRSSAEIHPAPLQGVTDMMTAAVRHPRTITFDRKEKMN